MQENAKRKKRSDRTHTIYKLVCKVTGQFYIGMTVSSGMTPKAAVEGRFQRHVTRALRHNKDWNLCKAIRQHGPDGFERHIVTTVRGKAAAHLMEREITKQLGASLNTA